MTVYDDDLTPKQRYMREYYRMNKKHIQARKRRKYRADKEYRQKIRIQARNRYRKLRGDHVPVFGDLSEEHPNVIVRGGVTYYPIGYAADSADVSVQTIRRWCNLGIIPETMKEGKGRRWRWFTLHQVTLLKQMKGYNYMTHAKRQKVRDYLKENWDIKEVDDAEIIKFGPG